MIEQGSRQILSPKKQLQVGKTVKNQPFQTQNINQRQTTN